MTESFTEEQIREALLGQARANNDYVVTYTEQVIAALKKPKIQFTNGQVFVNEDGVFTRFWEDEDGQLCVGTGSRNLTLTEHGPTVKALREYVKNRARHGSYNAQETLAAFDEVIHD